MDLNFAEVEEYLSNVKKAVKEGRYEIERNANREANSMLFRNYLISEEDAKKIIYNLTPMDFSEAVRNRKPQYADEILYIYSEKKLSFWNVMVMQKKKLSYISNLKKKVTIM